MLFKANTIKTLYTPTKNLHKELEKAVKKLNLRLTLQNDKGFLECLDKNYNTLSVHFEEKGKTIWDSKPIFIKEMPPNKVPFTSEWYPFIEVEHIWLILNRLEKFIYGDAERLYQEWCSYTGLYYLDPVEGLKELTTLIKKTTYE